MLLTIRFRVFGVNSQNSNLSLSKISRSVSTRSYLTLTKKLQVNMANIRRKFGERPGNAKFIQNELGVGYRMNAGDEGEK